MTEEELNEAAKKAFENYMKEKYPNIQINGLCTMGWDDAFKLGYELGKNEVCDGN